MPRLTRPKRAAGSRSTGGWRNSPRSGRLEVEGPRPYHGHGDWGAIVTDLLGVQAPEGLLGIHSNMADVVPADAWQSLARNVLGAGDGPPPGLSEEEGRTFEQLNFFFARGVGYGVQMGTRPQTMYGLADSPVTLAAWMINRDASSYADIAAAFAGHPVGGLTRDEVLDNVTFTWLTDTGVSSARLYWENTVGFFNIKGVSVPAAVSTFAHEIYKVPRGEGGLDHGEGSGWGGSGHRAPPGRAETRGWASRESQRLSENPT